MNSQAIHLTSREIEITKLIVKEFSIEQIAEQLQISSGTVYVHRRNIFNKIKAQTIVKLIRYAYENNLVE
jgi:DNA-binding CsgD family transcriptional regulator